MRHIGESLVKEQIEAHRTVIEVANYAVDLAPGDTAWNPTSTKDHHLRGPARVTYRLYSDGGWEVSVRDTAHRYA